MAGSQAARYAVIKDPVHKALVYSEGFENLPIYSPIVFAKGVEKDMIKGVINTYASKLNAPNEKHAVVQINIERAEAALKSIRSSLDKSFEYERLWFDSGLPLLSPWLLEGVDSAPETIKPTVYGLIKSLLSTTESQVTAAEAEHNQKVAAATIPTATRTSLSTLLAEWSENAHTELRDQLDVAFGSPDWSKLLGGSFPGALTTWA